MLNLTTPNRNALASAVPWPVDFLKINFGSGASSIVRLTNHFHDIVVDENPGGTPDNQTYMAAGEFLAFSDIADNLEVKDNTLDISLSGVDQVITALVLGSNLEGSTVEVSRGFYIETTGRLAGENTAFGDLPQPIFNRWTGNANSYSITDDYAFDDGDKVVVSISCKSLLNTIIAKVSGRYTSPQGFKAFNDTDTSMEFVASLPTFNPNFGAED